MYPMIRKDIHWAIFPAIGYAIGWWLDRKETERMTLFRDKSALYGRVLKEDKETHLYVWTYIYKKYKTYYEQLNETLPSSKSNSNL
ncbi:unnamed protein product [Acanthoscelides obtectus]|uniref:NADH dehydrogenase [ubiquinone] 1 beta subcomplex subunit 1 n=1 Tax=Acanthoscelides obtectus TaxID=200917 RepID=A0A9P0LBD1_ACAOB|nr:unnamed protein product [Acanthoscelides obtectus]CAK1675675.1 NADH dehydrogenase [ubiquinone] 1 beta subcomplex subunit 1 [Acanthoscelides obtectus]